MQCALASGKGTLKPETGQWAEISWTAKTIGLLRVRSAIIGSVISV